MSPTRGVLKRPATDPDIPTTKVSQSHLELSDSEKKFSFDNLKPIISLPRHPRGIDLLQDTLQLHLSRYSVYVSYLFNQTFTYQAPKLEVTPATPTSATPIVSTEAAPVAKKLKAGDAPKTPKTFYGASAASRKTPVLPKTPASSKGKEESRLFFMMIYDLDVKKDNHHPNHLVFVLRRSFFSKETWLQSAFDL